MPASYGDDLSLSSLSLSSLSSSLPFGTQLRGWGGGARGGATSDPRRYHLAVEPGWRGTAGLPALGAFGAAPSLSPPASLGKCPQAESEPIKIGLLLPGRLCGVYEPATQLVLGPGADPAATSTHPHNHGVVRTRTCELAAPTAVFTGAISHAWCAESTCKTYFCMFCITDQQNQPKQRRTNVLDESPRTLWWVHSTSSLRCYYSYCTAAYPPFSV